MFECLSPAGRRLVARCLLEWRKDFKHLRGDWTRVEWYRAIRMTAANMVASIERFRRLNGVQL